MMWDRLFWNLGSATEIPTWTSLALNGENWKKISYFKEKYKQKIFESLNIDLNHPFLDELKKSFDSHLVSQGSAKEYLSQAVLDSVLKIWDSKWPLWVFFFHWPTWVWKTEIVKALAETMFWDPNWFIKINCENYADRYTWSNLFWAPKWYLWYNEKTPFNNKNITLAFDVAKQMKKLNKIISNMPWFNILLFDEIEKAHPEVIQQLLWILDEWKVTISNWEVVNFQNSIIIFTSNIWQQQISWEKGKTPIWFWTNWVTSKDIEKIFKASLKEKFKPEFIWRIHNFVEFNELSKDDCREIIDIQLNKLNQYLLKYFPELHIQLEISPDLYDYIIKKWYSSEKWARELVRTFNTLVVRYFTRLLHSDEFTQYYDYPWEVLVWIDINNAEKLDFCVILDWWKVVKKEVKLLENKQENKWLTLDKLNQVYSAMSAYVELTYINLDWDIDLKDELKIYADKLKSFWLSQTDISSLKNRAYLEWLRDLVFLQDFEWIWNWDEIKDLFHPYEARTLIKIVERKFASIYWEKWNISKRKFIIDWTKSVVEIVSRLLKVEELTWSQVNQLLFYVRKVLVEKYWINTDY